MKKNIVILIILTIFPLTVFAKQGCCSHHGGVSGDCSTGGYQICNDGTESPSCTCYVLNDNNEIGNVSENEEVEIQNIEINDTNTVDKSEQNNSINKDKTNKLKKKITKLNKNLEREKNKSEHYKMLFTIVLITFGLYYVYNKMEK